MYNLTTSSPVRESDVPIWPPPVEGIVVLTLVIVVGMAGNLLIIITYLSSRQLRTPPNMLYVNLALTDLIFNMSWAICVVTNMAIHNGASGFGDSFCFVHGFFLALSYFASTYSIGLIAICRYIIIVNPTKKKYMTWGFCLGACVSSWLLAILLLTPLFTDFGRLVWHPRQYQCIFDYSYNLYYNVILFSMGFGAVSVIICFCYLRIYTIYIQSRQRVTAGIHTDNNSKSKEEFRLALQLLVVYLLFVIGWVPYFTVVVF